MTQTKAQLLDGKSATIQFTGGSASAPAISFTGDTNTGIYSPGADQVAISTNGTGRLFVDASGNIGAGVAAPSFVAGYTGLQVNGGSNGSVFKLTNSTTGTTSTDGFDFILQQGGNEAYIWQRESAPLVFGTAATERLRITSDGKVGLGTSVPGAPLDVVGSVNTVLLSDSATNAALKQAKIQCRHYTSSEENLMMIYAISDSASSEINIGGGSSAQNYATQIGFWTAANNTSTTGTERLRITSDGKVGVGTASPSTLIHGVGGNLRIDGGATGSVFIAGTSTTPSDGVSLQATYAGSGSYGPLMFFTSGSERGRFDSSGRLLVGTSSSRNVGSSVPLLAQIESTSGNYPGLAITQNGADTGAGYLFFGKSRGTSIGSSTVVADGDRLGSIRFAGADGTDLESLGAQIEAFVDGTPGANDMPGRLVFSTCPSGSASPVERVRIQSNGGVWSQSTAHNLFMLSSQAAGTTYFFLNGRHSSSGFNTGTNSFYVYTNGNVVNTNNSYGAISDLKLKENIVDASSQWSDIKALRPVNYNFKEGQTHTQLGLIAQEVELVSPGLVTESPDRDEDGNDLGTVTKSVNYSVLYMKAVKALQEAMERIETLEAKVAALESA